MGEISLSQNLIGKLVKCTMHVSKNRPKKKAQWASLRKPNSDFENYRIVNSVCVLYLSHRLILSKKNRLTHWLRLSPYLSALYFWHSLVWIIVFDELDKNCLNSIFLLAVAWENLAQTGKKSSSYIQSIYQTRNVKNQMQIDRGCESWDTVRKYKNITRQNRSPIFLYVVL